MDIFHTIYAPGSRHRRTRLLIGLALLAIVAATVSVAASRHHAADAATTQIECSSAASRMKAVRLDEDRITKAVYNYPKDGLGHFDPLPLIATTVTVGGTQPSCLVAAFSAMARPLDNHIVFQVRVDGIPMQGHLGGIGGLPTPVVVDPTEANTASQRMVAYNFFAPVRPGVHRVEVLFAGCCSADPPKDPETGIPLDMAVASSPVLVLHHN